MESMTDTSSADVDNRDTQTNLYHNEMSHLRNGRHLQTDPGMEKDIIIYYGGNNKSSLPFNTELHSVAFSNTAYDIMTDD